MTVFYHNEDDRKKADNGVFVLGAKKPCQQPPFPICGSRFPKSRQYFKELSVPVLRRLSVDSLEIDYSLKLDYFLEIDYTSMFHTIQL